MEALRQEMEKGRESRASSSSARLYASQPTPNHYLLSTLLAGAHHRASDPRPITMIQIEYNPTVHHSHRTWRSPPRQGRSYPPTRHVEHSHRNLEKHLMIERDVLNPTARVPLRTDFHAKRKRGRSYEFPDFSTSSDSRDYRWRRDHPYLPQGNAREDCLHVERD